MHKMNYLLEKGELNNFNLLEFGKKALGHAVIYVMEQVGYFFDAVLGGGFTRVDAIVASLQLLQQRLGFRMFSALIL